MNTPATPHTDMLAQPFEVRAEAMLSHVFRGMHHVYSLKKFPRYWTCIHSQLSTFDYDTLTRLVIGAHDYAIRVELNNGGPQAIKLMLHPRQREGIICQRHPTIEAAIQSFRK